jgi:2-keto-4-pentenoate hydratase/2-oxohepta-3-ene-1,7-dioic acid hydratase in catechol pathway
MKLISYRAVDNALQFGIHAGILQADGESILPLAPFGFADARAFIAAGQAAFTALNAPEKPQSLIPVAQVQILAPILNPPRVFAIGLNYQEHAAESKMKVQVVPTVFFKLTASIVGDGAEIVLPSISTQPDYEAELAVVIGKGGFEIKADDWEDHVFGYTILNDVSARDVQLATSQWTLGKSFPTFTPMGPAIVTADEVPDPHALAIKLSIDGETLQDANTRDLIFRIPALIEYISAITPLEPGDIISTGTPQGVGLGRTPQRWLKPGEEVVIEIEKLGTLRNRTTAQKR